MKRIKIEKTSDEVISVITNNDNFFKIKLKVTP